MPAALIPHSSCYKAVRNIFYLPVLGLLLACQSMQPPPPQATATSPSVINDVPQIDVNSPTPVINESTVEAVEIVHENLWDRMRAGFQLKEFYRHESVADKIPQYTDNQRYFDLVTARAEPFLYWIVDEIDRRQLPQELALLPFIESSFNPNAYSRQHAVGLWQFIAPTGKSLGLQQDWWYDGRRDPQASTIAALNYLETLYKQFNQDWLLALAAYNTGEGNVRRAIRRSGYSLQDVSFWDLRLAGETRSHIPKILALASVISNPEHHGITLNPVPNAPALQMVEIGSQIDISQAAKLAQMDYIELRELNPGYLQWATHPDHPQQLLLPESKASKLIDGLAAMGEQELVTWDRYQIATGDTLGGIARKLGTRVDILQTVNDLSGSRIIAGNSLLIPRTSDTALLLSSPPAVNSDRRPNPSIPAVYTIRRGDNLWSIARRYQLRSKEIAAWNRLHLDQILQPGQTLDLRYATDPDSTGKKSLASENRASYQVRAGDTMVRIARAFDIQLQDLLLWNDISSNELIHPGQTITITSQGSGLN